MSQTPTPRYADLTRKELRCTDTQLRELSALRRRLNTRRQGSGERITDNTLIRVAIDLLLANKDEVDGNTEEELLQSLGLEGTHDYERVHEQHPLAPLYEHQRGLCAVCEQPRHLVVDHDHKTGMVRGLLCVGCNKTEGEADFPWIRAYRANPPARTIGLSVTYSELN